MVKELLSRLISTVGAILRSFFGRFSWSAPVWFITLRQHAQANPKRFFGIVAGIFFSLLILFYGYQWYQHLPKPVQVVGQITPPKITPVDNELIPDLLTIDFGVIANGQLLNRSVAPLNNVGKTVIKGVSITPDIKGSWLWESDSQLTFTPEQDWPAGQTYTIQFDKDFFTKNSKVSDLSYQFTTLPFQLAVTDFKFYQDPINPSVRQAVATISFTHPVDVASLENKISVQWQAPHNGMPAQSKDRFKFTLTFDKNKRTAYIHSEPIPLPDETRYLELNIEKGVKPLNGPSETTDETNQTISVPDAASYFKVVNANAAIVRNQDDHPEQVLTVETTLGMTQADLNKSLHVYVLPKDMPAIAGSEAKIDYPWQDPGEVTDKVLALAKPLTLTAIPAAQDYATLHSFKFNVATPTYLFFKLDKGTQGYGNLTLANDYVAIIKAPEFPQEISFLHKGALLALGTEEKLSVLVRGLAAVKFEIARVLPEDVNHLITQTSGDFSNPYFINTNFNQQNISDIFSEIQQFNAADPAKEQYTALDLGKYLKANRNSGGNLGLFLLQAHGWDVKNNYALDVQNSRLVLITDLGLIVKDNLDGTHDVFVQSLTKGSPASGVSVSILGKNGVALFTRSTDTQGRVTFPSLRDFTDEKEPTVYTAKNGSDVSFIPYAHSDRLLNFSRFDIGGVSNNTQNQAALTAFMFTDRGIYRPGDMAHIGMIVKQPYVMPAPQGIPLELMITDPRGTTAVDQKIALNSDGYLTTDFKTNATSPTGQYVVSLYIVKDNHASSLIGSTTLNVAEFLPDRMRITAQLIPEQAQGWRLPSELNAKVGLWNLYGAPATNRRITGSVLLSPQAVSFKEFPDYRFHDPLIDPKQPPKVLTESLTETHTDDQGQAQLELHLDKYAKATYQLTLFVEGFEAEGGRSVKTQVTTLVSPLNYLVGYKADGDLGYIKQNTPRQVNIIAINPQLQPQFISGAKLQLFRQQPVTTLVKKPDGTYQYQSIIQTSQLSSTPLTISDKGFDYALPTQTIGDYLVTLIDQNGTELNSFKFSVVGNSQQPLPKNAELNIKLNKSEYNPGEDIEVQITAPYTGAGLITVERDKVYATQWFKTTTTSSVQKIHLPSDFQGDGYINVAFVRDINSPEIFMSPLSYAVTPFMVSYQPHTMHIDLTAADVTQPGEALAINYKTDKPGKIIVYAVDEGVLQVANYKTPDPLSFFFQKHSLEVYTMQILDQILPKFIANRELSAVGGDAAAMAARMMTNLNPFKRKVEAPVVYWSGIIDTDTNPHQLTYTVPDYFNGSLRIMAVAVAPNATGAATKSTEVKGHFVISPNVPTFVAPGDTFEVTASIANNVAGSGPNANVAVLIEPSSQLQVLGPVRQNVTIGEGKEETVHYKVTATAQLGSADLKLYAVTNGQLSKISSTLSIRPAIPFASYITSGSTIDSKVSLPLDHDFYAQYRDVQAAISPSPLILLMGLDRYLKDYPYGCTEQLISKVLPLLAMSTQPSFAQDAKTIADKIQQTIQALGQRQMASGAFNYWPEVGTTKSNDFATLYAMHFLTDAREQGIQIPNDMFASGISYLKDFVTQDVTTLEEARLHAYAIYLLTRNELVTTNYLTNLQLTLEKQPSLEWKKDITSAYIAATYQLLKSTKEAEKMIQYYDPSNTSSTGYDDFYNKDIANAQYLYLVARHFPTRAQGLSDSLIPSLVTAMNNDSINTVLSGYTSLAFAAYGHYYPTVNETNISISAVDKDAKSTTLSASNGLYQSANIFPDTKQVVFDNPLKQVFFYQLTQAGFDKTLPTKVSSHGIEVSRDYRSADDGSLDNVHIGDEISVHIRIRSTDDQYHDNIAIVDLLPGGFEVVQDSVKVTNMDYADVREDRVIFFGGASSDMKEIVYRIKATNRGKYVVPPMFAASMYNPQMKSIGAADSITIE